jgi:regulator of sirC expression with transglutaminase-like and TPR domain
LPENQRTALVQLLADDDPAVHQTIREKLLSFGHGICDWLQPFTLSNDPVIRKRVKDIVVCLSRQDADDRFLHFCLNSGEELNLEDATNLLAQTQYPGVNAEAYVALYDTWAGSLKDRIKFDWKPEKILETINGFLFKELGFSGDDNYGFLPERSYMNCIVDRRLGNPIGLCSIYLFLSRRLCLPVTGIGMPGHFVCRYQSSTREIYLDVFRGGRFLTKADCIKYLRHTPQGLHSGYLAPVSTRRMLSRMCGNLHQTYSHLEHNSQAARIQRYLVALAR